MLNEAKGVRSRPERRGQDQVFNAKVKAGHM